VCSSNVASKGYPGLLSVNYGLSSLICVNAVPLLFYSGDNPENHLMVDRVRRAHSLELTKNASPREVRYCKCKQFLCGQMC